MPATSFVTSPAPNPNLTPASRELFTALVRQSGMPVSEADMVAAWNEANVAEGSQFTNASAFSPFWRLMTAIATKPCKWLVNVLVEHALPNVFLRFSGGAWLDVYAWGVDVARKGSQPATGHLVFTRQAGTSGTVRVPVGTVVESPRLGDTTLQGGTVYRVISVAEAVIAAGEDSVLVPVQAEAPGEAFNLGPGYYSILPNPVPGVASAHNDEHWLDIPGADEEADDALRLRCRNQFAAVGQYHHDAAYRALMAAFAGIRTDHIFFEKEAPRGPGTANAHVMVESGVPPQDLMDALNAHIRESGNHGHGDDLLCLPITPLPVDLTVIVHPAPGLAAERAERAETLRRGVEDRVRCAFRENTDFAVTRVLPLARFSFSRLAEELHTQLPDLASVEFTRPAAGGAEGEALLWEDLTPLRQLPVLGSFAVTLRGGL